MLISLKHKDAPFTYESYHKGLWLLQLGLKETHEIFLLGCTKDDEIKDILE